MNKEHPERNWRRIFSLFVLFAVLVYGFGEPYFEKLLGVDLPSIRAVANSGHVENPEVAPSRTSIEPVITSHQESATATLEKPGNDTRTRQKTDSAAKPRKSGPYLSPTGKKNRLRSPAGLIYGESRGEHRVDHVMKHGQDDKSRPVHSVFTGSREEILQLIDEAYQLVKSKSPRVTSKPDERLDFRIEHKIDMRRKIGYLGGQRGRRENYPPRSKLTLVLDNGKFVVTAYPDR